GGRATRTGRRRVHTQLALRYGDRDPDRLGDRRTGAGLFAKAAGESVWKDVGSGPALAAYHRRDAGARLHHALLGSGCDSRPGVRPDRSPLPVLRNDARVAW